MKILVLGHGGHGKGTFCKMLEEIYGLTSMSSSQAALPYIFPALVEYSGDMGLHAGVGYATPEEAYERRHQCRELWKELISLYNCPDKSTLAREIISKADIYDGMRCDVEFAAARPLFDLVLWVDASDRVGPDPTMMIQRTSGMWVINNNGDTRQLWQQAIDLRLDMQ